MKFEVEFCSTQQYLPSQRHKKLRCRCENHFFDVEVSEVRNDEFPVAFIVSSEGNGRSEIRIRDKNLYQKVIRGQKTLSEMVNHKLTNIDSPSNYLMRKLAALGKLESDFTENSVIVADDAEEQKRLICEQAKDYIIFKGNLWERCDEPGYYVTLFPYGSIHFGIAVDSRFRSGRFFNAFEKSKVIAFAKQILQESIDKLDYVDRDDKYDKYLEERASCCEIQVLMPEMVTKCHEFLSKQDFLQKCKSIVRGEITEFGGELEGVSVDVVNEGGQLAIDIRTGIFGASGCSDSYDLHENDIETIWNSVVKKIRSYHYQRVLKKTQNFWRFARCDICDSAYAGIPDAAGRGRKRDRELENRNTRNSELDLRYSSTISKEDSIFLAV